MAALKDSCDEAETQLALTNESSRMLLEKLNESERQLCREIYQLGLADSFGAVDKTMY